MSARHTRASSTGVLNAFSDRLVKNGPLPKELGRLLKHAETFRYVADYEGDPVELDDARKMVTQAETFVAAMRAEFMPDESVNPACATPST